MILARSYGMKRVEKGINGTEETEEQDRGAEQRVNECSHIDAVAHIPWSWRLSAIGLLAAGDRVI